MLIHLKKKFQKKKIFYDFIFLSFVLTIYFSPLVFFGLDRIEDYQFSHFTLQILSENYFSPFLFFYDLLGPGTRLPLGSGLIFFFPPSFFISNLNTFYFLTFLFGAYLQLNYIKKTFKFFNIQNKYLFFLFYAFNIEFLMHVYIGDSLKTYITVSSFPLIFYYFIKFINLKTSYYFFKLILIIGYIFLNAHEAFVLTNSIGFFLLIILNKKFFYFKEKYFYLGVFALILILGENIYRLSYDLSYYKDGIRASVFDLDLKHYSSGIVFFLKFLETTYGLDFPYLSEFKHHDNFWLPFGGIFFYFAFYEAVRLFIKKKSADIFYLNIAFIFLIFISCLDLSKISFSIINTPFVLRDINNFFSLILFGIFLKNLRYNKIIIFISLIFTAVHVFTTIEYQHKLSKKK